MLARYHPALDSIEVAHMPVDGRAISISSWGTYGAGGRITAKKTTMAFVIQGLGHTHQQACGPVLDAIETQEDASVNGLKSA
jgi:hypothetical protein